MSFHHQSCLFAAVLTAALFVLFFDSQNRAMASSTVPVEAQIYSTLASTAAHRPQMAMDGDPSTYFKSTEGMDDGDDFIVLLSQPIAVQSLHIVTGDDDGIGKVTAGVVETSADNITFKRTAAFDRNGVVNTPLHGQLVEALRIRLDTGSEIPTLIVREISLDSPSPISHVEYGPGRPIMDISHAPDLAAWAKSAQQKMEDFWPDTDALLYSDGFISPNTVNVVFLSGPNVTGVAATGGGVMTVNADWCRAHPEDTGLTVHEMAHVIQAYSGYGAGWLVEGIADYIRWVKFEPQNFQPHINVQKATYHDAYRTTAAFLGWCELHYDSCLVTKLNHALRDGDYNNNLFELYCGKDVDTLWKQFTDAYTADPTHILTPAIAPADQPRNLPVVKAGTSVAADLTSAFDTIGIYKDGASFSSDGGIDADGAAYSAKLLGTSLTWNKVTFAIGPTGAPDAISCASNTIHVPSDEYSSLWLLGTSTAGVSRDTVVTVNYADDSKAEFQQNFSDWYEPQEFPGERIALATKYRNLDDGTTDARTFNVYAYGFALDSSKSVVSVTLPDNGTVRILAVTLAN